MFRLSKLDEDKRNPGCKSKYSSQNVCPDFLCPDITSFPQIEKAQGCKGVL